MNHDNHVILCDSEPLKYEHSILPLDLDTSHFMSFHVISYLCFVPLGVKDTEVGDGTTSVVIIAAELHGPLLSQ